MTVEPGGFTTKQKQKARLLIVSVRERALSCTRLCRQLSTAEPACRRCGGGATSRPTHPVYCLFDLLQDFGEHGREFISSELGLLLMQTLADPSKLMGVFGDEARGRKLAAMLQGTVMKVRWPRTLMKCRRTYMELGATLIVR